MAKTTSSTQNKTIQTYTVVCSTVTKWAQDRTSSTSTHQDNHNFQDHIVSACIIYKISIKPIKQCFSYKLIRNSIRPIRLILLMCHWSGPWKLWSYNRLSMILRGFLAGVRCMLKRQRKWGISWAKCWIRLMIGIIRLRICRLCFWLYMGFRGLCLCLACLNDITSFIFIILLKKIKLTESYVKILDMLYL